MHPSDSVKDCCDCLLINDNHHGRGGALRCYTGRQILCTIKLCCRNTNQTLLKTSSRLLWSLARDDALIFSRWVSIMDSRWESPIWALLLNFFIVLCIGCVQLGSSAAFNAIVGVSLILQLISYAMPSALLLYRRRSTRFLPRNRDFKISFGLGWVANILPPVWAIVGTIFYCFPFFRPVTGSNMSMFHSISNYSSSTD